MATERPVGAPPGQPVNEQGLSVAQELLRRPPGEVAEWVLDQVASLSKEDVKVEELPIFQVASALKAVPVEHKQALARSAVQGFGALPPSRKAEAVRLAMQAQSVVQQAEDLELTRMAEREHAKAMQRLAALEQSAPSRGPIVVEAKSDRPPNYEDPEVYQRSVSSSTKAPPLVENLLRVAKVAKFNEMPQEELVTISQAAQTEASRVVQPQQLLDVVTELNPDEREQLTSALVDAHVVPEGQRGVLEEAVRPGGYADKLSAALALANRASEYMWVAVALPFVELFLAMLIGWTASDCPVALDAWLRSDAILMCLFVVASFITMRLFAPIYAKLEADPFGTVQRWQSASKARSWRVRLQAAVPDIPFDTYRYTAIGLVVCIVLLLLGAAWAIVGVFELLGAMLYGCSFVALFVCTLFVGLRFLLVVGLVLLLYFILDEIQKHRSRQVVLGSANISQNEDSQPLLRTPSSEVMP